MNINDSFSKAKTITANDVKRLFNEGKAAAITLLDVRQPEEYQSGHIPGAVLLPLPELPGRLKELDASEQIITYCRSGRRSYSAAALMSGQGFKYVYSMDGGITAWNGLVASGQYEKGLFLFENIKTPQDMLLLAWTLEDAAQTLYSEIQNIVADDETKKIFGILANAEELHKKNILNAHSAISDAPQPDEKSLNKFVRGFAEGGISLDKALLWANEKQRTPNDFLEYAMQLEINSLDLYSKIFRQSADQTVKNILNSIVEDEKAHLNRLGALLGNRSVNE